MADDQRKPKDVIFSQGLHPHLGPEMAGSSMDPVFYRIADDEEDERKTMSDYEVDFEKIVQTN